MRRLLSLYRSAVGQKAVMAVTGLILFGWMGLHLFGCLKFFFGPEPTNEYSHWLRTLGTPALPSSGFLWIVRIGLLLATVLHIHSSILVTRKSRAARPVAYRLFRPAASAHTARTMRWGGFAIALFTIYHLLHLTTGTLHDQFIAGDPYRNMITAYRVWWISAVYIAANVFLGLHLYHGLESWTTSLGITHTDAVAFIRDAGRIAAVAMTIGFISIPIAVMLGWS